MDEEYNFSKAKRGKFYKLKDTPMKKPEKWNLQQESLGCNKEHNGQVIVRNKTIDEMDKYWQEKIKAEYVRRDSLPSVEEIILLIKGNVMYDYTASDTPTLVDVHTKQLATAIHERLQEGGK